MRQPLADLGIAFTPAARTIAVATALRRLRRHVDVVNTHMTAADLGAAFGLVGVRARPAVVATRHFAKPRGRIGPLPIDRLVRSTVDAEIAISAAVAASIGTPSTVVHSGVDARPVPDRAFVSARCSWRSVSNGRRRRMSASRPSRHPAWQARLGSRDRRARAARKMRSSASSMISASPTSVRFLGFRSDLAELMARAGMLLAPCPNEGLGLTVLEAMASALPVVAADAGGHTELLIDLDDRALFAAGDVDAAAQPSLRRLAQDPAARAALGARERERQSDAVHAAAAGRGIVRGLSGDDRRTVGAPGTKARR